MKRMDNRIPREELSAIILFALVCLILGGVAGWSARTVHGRNANLVAIAETDAASTDSRQQQFNKFIKE